MLNPAPITMMNEDGTKIKKGYLGFSFTAALLSPFVQMYRKDLKGFLFYFVIFYLFGTFVTPYVVINYGVYMGYGAQVVLWILCGFTYNKVQMLILLNDHYLPKTREDMVILQRAGYYVKGIHGKSVKKSENDTI